MTTLPTTTHLSARDQSDVDDAALFAFKLLNELGLTTEGLTPADLRSLVRPLLTRLELRVAAPERLEREHDDAAHLDYIEAIHAARARGRLREANAIADMADLPW